MTVAAKVQPFPPTHLASLLSREVTTQPVLNTFIHFDCKDVDDDAPKPEGLQRCRSEPSPATTMSGCSHSDSSMDEVDTTASEQLESDCEYELADETPNSRLGEQELFSTSQSLKFTDERSEDDSVTGRAISVSSRSITGRKLRSKDTRLAISFTFPSLTDSTKEDELIMTLYPVATSRRRGCSGFSASKGKADVHIKCGANAADVDLALSIVVKEQECMHKVHNFAREPVCKLAEEWQFIDLIDAESDTLDLFLSLTVVGKLSEARINDCDESEALADLTDDENMQCSSNYSNAHWPGNCSEGAYQNVGYPCVQVTASAGSPTFRHQEPFMWTTEGRSSTVTHEVREGDWICECGDFQFARNDACRLCNRPKPKPLCIQQTNPEPTQVFPALCFVDSSTGQACMVVPVIPLEQVGTAPSVATLNRRTSEPEAVVASNGDAEALSSAEDQASAPHCHRRRRRRRGSGRNWGNSSSW